MFSCSRIVYQSVLKLFVVNALRVVACSGGQPICVVLCVVNCHDRVRSCITIRAYVCALRAYSCSEFFVLLCVAAEGQFVPNMTA